MEEAEARPADSRAGTSEATHSRVSHSSHSLFLSLSLTNNSFSLKKTEVMCLLLHAVDVSHPTKDWNLHREWTARCMEEFFKQGDQEREMGLDISPLCDRNTTQVPQSQIGFIDYIVVPLFNTVLETVEHLGTVQ